MKNRKDANAEMNSLLTVSNSIEQIAKSSEQTIKMLFNLSRKQVMKNLIMSLIDVYSEMETISVDN